MSTLFCIVVLACCLSSGQGQSKTLLELFRSIGLPETTTQAVEQQPGQHTTQPPGQQSSQQSGQQPGQQLGQQSGQQSNQQSNQQSGQQSGQQTWPFYTGALSNSLDKSISSAGTGTNAVSTRHLHPYCSDRERNTVFNNCAMTFGMAHLHHFGYLARNKPVCRVHVFSCSQVDSMMKCVNAQPVSVISDNCFANMKNELTNFLGRYDLPCTYDDLARKCHGVDLLPIDKRPQDGVAPSTNYFDAIINIFLQYILPLMVPLYLYLSHTGGLGQVMGYFHF